MSYCVRCKRKTGSSNPRPFTARNGRKMTKSTCTVCGGNKSTIGGVIPFAIPAAAMAGALASGALSGVGHAAGSKLLNTILGSGAKKRRRPARRRGRGCGCGKGLTPFGGSRGSGGYTRGNPGYKGRKGGMIFGMPSPLGIASRLLL